MNRRPVAPPPKPKTGAARTIILVAIAAVLAGLIIGRGLSNRPSGTSSGGTGNGTTTRTTKVDPKATTTTGPQSTTTTQPPVNLGTFTAVVLNGNGIPGTAGARTTELGALGVKVAKAADAVSKDFAASQLYALNAESEAAARLLSARTGIAYGGGYPTTNPPAAVDKLGGATIVLLLGKDVANKPITDISGAPAATATTAAAVPTATTAAAG
jgi:hypothetical protein